MKCSMCGVHMLPTPHSEKSSESKPFIATFESKGSIAIDRTMQILDLGNSGFGEGHNEAESSK